MPRLVARSRVWMSLVVALAAGSARGGPPEAVGPYLDGRLPRTAPEPSGGWKAVPAFPLLSFEDPTFLVAEPGSSRLYVGGRQGLIEAFDGDPNASSKATVLDLRRQCQGFDDSGLMGLAFHPEFAKQGSPNRGYFYVFYNQTRAPRRGPDRPENRETTNRLSRFTVPDGSTSADPNSELVLIDQVDENLWHNGGGLFFHPRDGFLYLSLGDEGGDYGNAQRIDRDLFSGVIRIDVDRRGGPVSHPIRRQPDSGTTDHYFIPNDNPWVGVPEALEEFWCIGLRSPHRMTVDPPTGRVWLGDVGEGTREEIDLVEKGANFQWRYREGTAGTPDPRPSPLIGRDTPPVHDYGRDQGSAVIGGYVYRGLEHARDLVGKYVFADMNGRIWALSYDEASKKAAVAHLCDLAAAPSRSYGVGISSFGVDRLGELYICRMGDQGAIFKLARSSSLGGGAWPRTLSKTGAFGDLKTLTPSPGLVAYQVNAPLWSDGASKSRWVAVPRGEAVGFSPSKDWAFPAGTVFVKHFEMAVDETRADAPRRRLETRFLVKDAAGSAFGATYRWRPDGSDADLLDDARTEEIAVKTASGKRSQTWAYPSPRECLMCHTPASRYVLGVNTRQLNGPKSGSGNQLVAWDQSGLFRPGFDGSKLADYPRLVGFADPSASLDAKVRSYLDSNCAHCHRPDGVRARFDARYETDLARQGLIDGPALNPIGLASPRLVAPGDVARSILHRRLASLDAPTRMPPLARNRRDDEAIAAVRAWIERLPSGPKPPEIRLAPLKPRIPAGTEVKLAAEVVGEGIKRVEFFRGDSPEPIARADSPPYRATWKAEKEGSYLLTARATDARGASATSLGTMVTVEPPPPPGEGPVTYLDDLRWTRATNGFGPVERKTSNGEDGARDGRAIRLRGKTYNRGLGVHAPSGVRYALDGSPALFLAEIGLDDETGGNGRVVFQVWLDGEKVFDSGPIDGRTRTRTVRVDVTGKRDLTLIVTDGGDGIGSDHADWADARLVRTPAR